MILELIHKILTDASNATREALMSKNDVDDRGALSSLAAALFSYITGGDVDVRASVTRFFDQLFAAVYLQGASADVQPSTVDCVAGVRRQRGGSSVPFGGADGALGDDITRSARVARVLLDALRVADVVAQSMMSVDLSHQCSRALTRLSYCAACEGVVDPALPRPCRSFCDNVARGCFVHLVAGQIGRRWEYFIDAINQLGSFGVTVTSRNDLESVVADLPRLVLDEVSRLQGEIHNYRSEVRFETIYERLSSCLHH